MPKGTFFYAKLVRILVSRRVHLVLLALPVLHTSERFTEISNLIANDVDGETLIIASYDNDSMIACKVYPNAIGDVEIKVAEALNTSGATKVKAFLWKNLESCVPVCNSAEGDF